MNKKKNTYQLNDKVNLFLILVGPSELEVKLDK